METQRLGKRGMEIVTRLLLFTCMTAFSSYAGDITIDGDMNVEYDLNVKGRFGVKSGRPDVLLENVDGQPDHRRIGFYVDGPNNAPSLLNFRSLKDNNETQADNILVLTASGKVGVGTSNPSEKLHVAGKAKIDDGVDVGDSFTVDNEGKVGIGTSNPEKTLHIKSGRPDVLLENEDGQADYRRVGFYVNGPDTAPSLLNFRSLRDDNTTQADNILVVTADGKVGIGTSNPSESLHVVGAAKFTGTARFEQGITYIPPMGNLSMGAYTQ